MPVSPTYPGVYIEEIPSGVHTLTGVGTSITAFVGYTPRGVVNEPVHLFSFADFERAFGDLDVESDLSYAVKHFFQNGGNEAYVVRVAKGAVTAGVTLRSKVDSTGVPVLEVAAAGAGTWGNNLRLDVDYATAKPDNLFNLMVTELLDRDGTTVPGRTEIFRNLSLNRLDPGYVIDTVNAGSQLIKVTTPAAFTITGGGESVSGTLALGDLTKIGPGPDQRDRLIFLLDGRGPYAVTLTEVPAKALPTALDELATALQGRIDSQVGTGAAKVERVGNTLAVRSLETENPERSSVVFLEGGDRNAAAVLKLGIANGGVERDAAAPFRPAQTGTVGAMPQFGSLPDNGLLAVEIRNSALELVRSVPLQLWGQADAGGDEVPKPDDAGDLAELLRAALRISNDTVLGEAAVSVIGGRLRVAAGPTDPYAMLQFVDAASPASPVVAELGLLGDDKVNVARYAPGIGVTVKAQLNTGPAGSDGTKPDDVELIGSELGKTGLYTLEGVDLFNLLVIPEASTRVLTEAIAYCTRRRAFVIIDLPETVATFAQAEKWMLKQADPLRSRNAAFYFPRLRAPDPMMNGLVRSFPAAGAIAGLYARTDSERGVWKAPAGTSASLAGATGLALALTDKENGVLNPMGLNCLRTFPVYGTISWGARTSRGADAQADEYKYVPVRRLALFLEESLYRGTQWAVFEPNDEPLWSQIRLNLGAFMHTLFAQGAFQGRTPREAYFVKCDKETTTQNDINLGRMNVVVGFAPLKPAEFVIIKIQQIAGAIQT